MDIKRITSFLKDKSLEQLISFNRELNKKGKTVEARRRENFAKIEFGSGDKIKLRQQINDYLNPAEEPKLFDLGTEEYVEKLKKQDIIKRLARGGYVSPDERALVGEEEVRKAEQINAMRQAFSVQLNRCVSREQAVGLYMRQLSQIKAVGMGSGSTESESGIDFKELYLEVINEEWAKYDPPDEESVKKDDDL